MRYEHTQYGPLHLILIATSTPMLLAASMVPFTAVRIVLLSAAGVMFLLAASFRRLTVRDGSDRLLVEFGPLPLFRLEIPYHEIEHAEAARLTVLDGWGIQYAPGRGRTWSLWGFGCVVLRLAGGRALRIGTDAPHGLADFLTTRLKERGDPA